MCYMRLQKPSILLIGLGLLLTGLARDRLLRAEQFDVRTWQTKGGLSLHSGAAVAQPSDGYLWVGTFDGLALGKIIRLAPAST